MSSMKLKDHLSHGMHHPHWINYCISLSLIIIFKTAPPIIVIFCKWSKAMPVINMGKLIWFLDLTFEWHCTYSCRSGNQVEGNPGPASGDETVSSVTITSFCFNFHMHQEYMLLDCCCWSTFYSFRSKTYI